MNCGRLWFHRMEALAGQRMAGRHMHRYPHVIYVERGSVRLIVGDREFQVEGPATHLVPAGHMHGVYAITDAVATCIHEFRHPDGTLVPFDWEPDEMQRDCALADLVE